MKILMIGAHPDDCEIECSGLAMKYVKDGHSVQMLSMCNGCGGHHEMKPKEIAERRYKEILAAAEYMGVSYDVWHDVPDCELYASLENRARLVRYIRNVKPDIIFCCRTNDYHADHRNAGLLVQDASYLLIVPNYCPDTPALEKMPIIMYYGDFFNNPPFKPDVAVDVGDMIERKLNVLNFHVSQMYEWLPFTNGAINEVPPADKPEERRKWLAGDEVSPDTPDEEILSSTSIQRKPRFAKFAAKFRDALIERYGKEKGEKVVYAEVFEVCEYGSPLTEEAKKIFFPY